MMKDLYHNTHHQTDLKKRKTLVSIAGLAAGTVLATTPLLAGATSRNTSARLPQQASLPVMPVDLDVTLVSIPGVQRETLKLMNLTDHEIVIERFHANKLVFDGEIVDCNDACSESAITIAAGEDLLVQFNHASVNVFETGAGDYLDVHALVGRLPAGTRVVKLGAYMIDSAAVLIQPNTSLIAA